MPRQKRQYAKQLKYAPRRGFSRLRALIALTGLGRVVKLLSASKSKEVDAEWSMRTEPIVQNTSISVVRQNHLDFHGVSFQTGVSLQMARVDAVTVTKHLDVSRIVAMSHDSNCKILE